MTTRFLPARSRALAALLGGGLVLGGAGSLATAAGPGEIRFSRDVLPILSDHCFACHGPDEKGRKGGLRLDTLEGARGAGKSGRRAVVPGHSAESELIRRVVTTDPDDLMPPPQANKPLSAAQVDILRRWIEGGAPWGRHWAFEPPARPASPEVRNPAWPRQPFDRFVLARLEREGLEPAAEASRNTLVRRLSLDLTGLPPSPEDMDQFVHDPDSQAYERLVDRLLASPRFGERMAWEWLEAARYADSNGYQGDGERTMWPWRDWVVEAFNRNLPFDQFTTWQLAGDRLPDATFETRLATGFLRNHMINGEGGRIAEENRIDYLFDQTETVATVWLGATFNCTRCHDHKYDPYTQRDYFGLLALFNRTSVDGGGGNPQTPPVLDVPQPDQVGQQRDAEVKLAVVLAELAELETRRFPRPAGRPVEETPGFADLPEELRGFLQKPPRQRDNGQLEKLAARWKESDPAYARKLDEVRQVRDQRDAVNRAIPRVMVMEDLPQARDTFLLTRGLYNQPGAKVPAVLPASLAGRASASPRDRLDLARWLTDPTHPLAARVTVNRLWQTLFGVGLVKTAEDFGVQGERPVHPELLDWLATEFIQSGWDLKHLVRRIVTSATYRQSSKVSPALAERDPENRLLARGARYRMPSWMIRDTALAAAGRLADRIGGPPVKPYQPAGVWEEATFGGKRYEPDHGEALYRRSLYVFWRRIIGPTMFFDVASRQTCTVKTPRTNVPLHALLTLNDVTYVEAARLLAIRVWQEGSDDPARLKALYRWVLGREPSGEELPILVQALARHRAHFAGDRAAAEALLRVGESRDTWDLNPDELAAWTLVAGTVLNLDEALTRE